MTVASTIVPVDSFTPLDCRTWLHASKTLRPKLFCSSRWRNPAIIVPSFSGEVGIVQERPKLDGEVRVPQSIYALRPIEGFAWTRSEVSCSVKNGAQLAPLFGDPPCATERSGTAP